MGLFDDLLEEEDKIQPTKRRGLFDDLLEEEDLVSPTAPPRTTAPQAQLLPPIEEMFKPKPREVGTFEGIANAARNAFASSQQALAVTGGVTPEEAKEISKIEFEKNARQVSPDYKEYQEAQGFDAVKAFARNPFEVTTNIVAEGLAGSLPALGAGLAAGGVGAAVAAPTVVGAPVGFLAGQVAGTFAGSLATEYGGKVLEELQGAGMDINNPDSITDFFSRQELVDAAKDKALKRGVPIAAFDALSAGIGGKVGAITKAAFKTKPREAVAEMAVQAALGGGGEVVGSLAAGDKIDPKAVFAEVVGEVGPGAAEIGVGKIQQTFAERRKQEQIKRAAKVSQDLENNNAPLTADALKTTVAKNAVEEEKATIEETDTALAEEAAKFAPPEDAITKQELKTQYSALSPEDLTDTEATFRERLDDEDPEMRTFAQNALDAIAEVRAEQERARKLPTDVLPTETPSATYGREADIYDVFADIRRRPMPPSGPAFESAQVIEEAARRADVLRRTPEGRELLRRELQGEEMVGGVRRATEEALATAPEPAEGDVFAEIRRPSRAEEAAITIEQQLTEDERIRRSQLGAEALREELAQVESLSRVADNTATDEEVVRLARQGLVNIQDGQNVITPRGEEVMQRGGAPLPRLTPEERTAEVAAAPAIVEQEPVAPLEITAVPASEAGYKGPMARGKWAVIGGPMADTPEAAIEEFNKLEARNLEVAQQKSDFESVKEKLRLGTWQEADIKKATRYGKTSAPRGEVEGILNQLGLKKSEAKQIVDSVPQIYESVRGTTYYEVGNVIERARSRGLLPAKVAPEQRPSAKTEAGIRDLEAIRTAAPTPVTTPPVTEAVTPAPAAPAEAAPVGIAVGNRVKTKTTPQSFVVEEVLPQSAREAELGEQYYSIRNERTGEVQTVEANDIRVVRGKGIRKLFAGEKAEMPQFRRDSLDAARAMAATGKTPEEIRAVTGWFPGKYDKKMRWEIPDQNAKLTTEAFLKGQGEPSFESLINKYYNVLKNQGTTIIGKLSDILDHKELYDLYPDLKNIEVVIAPLKGKAMAAFIESKPQTETSFGNPDTIELNARNFPKDLRSTLLHEIQHAIQKREGFARGASSETSRNTEDTRFAAEMALGIKMWMKDPASKNLSIEEIQRTTSNPNRKDLWPLARELVSKSDKELKKLTSSKKLGFEGYKKVAGEIEARDIQTRRDFTQEQLFAIAPYSSENIAPEEAIILTGSVDASSEVRAEEKYTPVPEADRYTFREASGRAIRFFGGEKPENFVIVNNTDDPDYEFKAGYDPDSGEIILNRAYIQKGENIEDILTHELGHYIYSDPQFQADFQSFLESMPDEARAEIDRIVNEGYNKETNEVQIEEREVMAFTSLIRRTKRGLTAWEKLKDTIKKIINRFLGTNITLSDQGAMAVFNVGYKRFKSGERIIREMREGVLKMAPEPAPAPEAAVEEAPADRPKRRTKMQNIIDISTGVKRPKTKLTVNEMTALKDQIKMRARRRREDKRSQREFAEELTKEIREMTIRGKVRPAQLRVIMSKALRTQFDNEASINGFTRYVDKVIENANYEKDLSSARAAIKEAQRLAKQKTTPGNISRYLSGFTAIDPRDIEPDDMSEREVEVDGEIVREKPVSLAEFSAVLREYMKAAGPVEAKDYTVIPDTEIADFLSKLGEQVKKNQEDQEKAAFAKRLEKALENKALLPAELDAVLNNSAKEYEDYLAKKQEDRRKKVENAINSLAEEAQIALAKYDNPEMDDNEKSILDFMKRVTLSDMSIGNRKNYIRIANNILVNNKFFGSEKFSSIAKGQIGALEASQDSKKIKRNSALIKAYNLIFRENLGPEISLGMQSFADTMRNITRPEEGVRLLYQMGFGDLERGRAASNEAKRKFTEAVEPNFKRIEEKTGQKINDSQGLVSSGVAATLIQIHPDETEAEGIQRMRGLIESDIERKKNSWKKEDRKTAILVEKALNEVYADSIEGILQNLKNTHPANYEVLTFLMNTVLPSYKPLFKKHDEMFNNQSDNYENPYYLPIRYRRISTEPVDPSEGIGNRMEGVASPKQSPNSIKRVKNSTLPENMQFDYNLVKNVIDSVSSQLDATYMNPGLQQVHSFLTSEYATKALGGAENVEVVRKRINSLVESRDRRAYDMTGWSRVFDTFANGLRNVGTTMLLGGIGQLPKQVPAQMLGTVINVNDKDITSTAVFETKAALPVLRQFSIGERGEIAGGARWISQLDTGYSKLERYIEDGVWSKIKDAMENLANVWLYGLKKGDSFAAAHGWISYYKKYLKDNDMPFTNWDNEARLVAEGDRGRVQAGLYADTQVDLYQGASDPTKMATFAQRGKTGAENMMKTIFLPFSSFAIQERTRFLTDLRDVLYGDAEEKKKATKGLMATISGIVTFHWVRRYALPAMFGYLAYGLYGLLGVEMDEPDEEEEKEKDARTFRKFLGEIAANITVGGYSSMAENALIDSVNYMAYQYDKLNETENALNDDGDVISWDKYRKERAPFYRYTGPGADVSLGMVGVIPDQLKSVQEKLANLSDEELMDSLTDEEKRVLILAGISDILYSLRLNDADVARMMSRMSDEIKKQAEERKKAQRALQRIYGQ